MLSIPLRGCLYQSLTEQQVGQDNKQDQKASVIPL